MQAMIWIGAALSLLGVAGLLWCVALAMKARGGGMDDDALRLRLQRIVYLNVGALGISALGLMLVVMGIVLG